MGMNHPMSSPLLRMKRITVDFPIERRLVDWLMSFLFVIFRHGGLHTHAGPPSVVFLKHSTDIIDFKLAVQSVRIFVLVHST